MVFTKLFARADVFFGSNPPADYKAPPFPSLHWPLYEEGRFLYGARDMTIFTLLWTLSIYMIVHVGAAVLAITMHLGKRWSNWKYVWIVPIFYILVAGSEAVLAGGLVGAIHPAGSDMTTCLLIEGAGSRFNILSVVQTQRRLYVRPFPNVDMDSSRRVSHDARERGHVSGNNAACTDGGSLADGNTCEDGNAATQPAILFYNDGLAELRAAGHIADSGVQRMRPAVKRTIGANKSPRADSDGARIDPRAIGVYIDIFPKSRRYETHGQGAVSG
ncbi:hypothetical protein OOU_Y34scaffold00033g45 [Pyricularia oryzae Y34]|uniref:Integral membrane protein n=1 Tax=Pyricularia oryzae (strain Y34) TaxID=1143189 RepID=A0AA97PAG5_PYRO3|nr:hypothetical protein OOU_Y34scaffold00033g45 [Pyricularia oryzae Y34]